MRKLILKKINHRGDARIAVEFDKNWEWINRIKSIPGRKWSATKNCWHLPYNAVSYERVRALFHESEIEILKNVNLEKVRNDKTFVKCNTTVRYVEYLHGEEVRKKVVGNRIIAKKEIPRWIELYVPFDKGGWIEVARNIKGRKWDVEKSCWLAPNVKASFRQLKKQIGLKHIYFDFEIETGIPDFYVDPIGSGKRKSKAASKQSELKQLTESQLAAIHKTEEQLTLKRYSTSTLKSYKNNMIALFLFYENKAPDQITAKDVEDYLLFCIRRKKISVSTQNQIINSFKFYAEKVLGQSKLWIDIPRPKKPKALPNVLSEKEVIRLLNAPKNLKHKLVLLIIYSGGMRLGEVVNLKTRDINIDRKSIHIKNAKGKKDRLINLADTVIPFLKQYLTIYKPTEWLFEGQTGGQYSKKSVQAIFYKAMDQAKISSYATVHTLRHSFATHCIENGYSTALVQEALGHRSIKTTEKYLHLSSKTKRKLKSPLDKLNLD